MIVRGRSTPYLNPSVPLHTGPRHLTEGAFRYSIGYSRTPCRPGRNWTQEAIQVIWTASEPPADRAVVFDSKELTN